MGAIKKDVAVNGRHRNVQQKNPETADGSIKRKADSCNGDLSPKKDLMVDIEVVENGGTRNNPSLGLF